MNYVETYEPAARAIVTKVLGHLEERGVRPGCERSDLEQAAREALVVAVERLEPERCDNIPGLLLWKMRCGVIDYLRAQGRRSREGVDRSTDSLDTSSDGGGRSRLETLAAAEPDLSARSDLRDALVGLSERQRFVVERVEVEGKTQASVAAELGISAERVSQLRMQGLERMREALGPERLGAGPTPLPDVASGNPAGLSRRELQVLAHYAEGNTAVATGLVLHISPETVKSHRNELRAKLGARNMAHALTLGFRAGLLA